MVLELGSCDLHTVLKEMSIKRKYLPVYKLIYYWMEILHAVQEIHDKGMHVFSKVVSNNYEKLLIMNYLYEDTFGICTCMSHLEKMKQYYVKNVIIYIYNCYEQMRGVQK